MESDISASAESSTESLKASGLSEQPEIVMVPDDTSTGRDEEESPVESDKGASAEDSIEDVEGMTLEEQYEIAAAAAESTTSDKDEQSHPVMSDKGKCCSAGYNSGCHGATGDTEESSTFKEMPNIIKLIVYYILHITII